MSAVLTTVREGLIEGSLIAFLGAETLPLGGASPVPTSPEQLAAALAAKVGVPGRIRTNVWAAAQYIETRKHRLTLKRLMETIFAPAVVPNVLHRWLAAIKPAMIVDAWYDDAMAIALSEGGGDWGQIQAVTRNGKHEDIWYRALNPDNTPANTTDWPTLLYKPHGAVRPNGEFLLSDSDYVEVLTEIDIQTPIPPAAIERRTDRGFAFLGCRFREQMERTFARQIIKRSHGPYYAVIAGELTHNEDRFLAQYGIERIDLPLSEAVRFLTDGFR